MGRKYTHVMGAKGVSRTARIALIVSISAVGLSVAASAVIAGIVESQPKAATSVKSSPELTRVPVVPTVSPTSHTPVRSPAPAAMPSALTTVTEPAVASRVPAPPAVTQPVPVPAPRPTVAAAPTCPPGTVVSGIMDVAFPKEHELVTGIWYVDMLGHGSISNKTTAAVDISLYIPYIEGLDVNGRVTINGFRGDFDYTPPPGVPRPSTLALQPGQTINYTFAEDGVSSTVLTKTIAWYSDPKYTVSNFTDLTIEAKCPKVTVVSPSQGPSIANTYSRH